MSICASVCLLLFPKDAVRLFFFEELRLLNCVVMSNDESIYRRIKNMSNMIYDFSQDVEEFRLKISLNQYDVIILDEANVDYDDALSICKVTGQSYVVFSGRFDLLESSVNALIASKEKSKTHKENEKLLEEEIKTVEKTNRDDKPPRNDDTMPLQTTIIREIEKIVTQDVYEGLKTKLEPLRIGFVNLYRGCGSSMVSFQLAKHSITQGMSTLYVDVCREGTSPYYTLHMSIDSKKEVLPLSLLKNGVKLTYSDYPHKDKIAFLIGEDGEVLDKQDEINLKSYLNYPVNIVNFGISKGYEMLLDSCDKIFVVIDPKPMEIDRHIELLNEFRNYRNVELIMTNHNASVNLKELKSAFGINPSILIPSLDAALVYKSYYSGSFIYESYKDLFGKCFSDVIQISNKEQNEQITNKSNIFKKMKGWKK